MVDWSQFGLEILSGIIVLGLGWLLAWRLIHRYQRRNIEINSREKMIEEIRGLGIGRELRHGGQCKF